MKDVIKHIVLLGLFGLAATLYWRSFVAAQGDFYAKATFDWLLASSCGRSIDALLKAEK